MNDRHDIEAVGLSSANSASNQAEMYSAAFHESSHAIIAWALGANVGDLSIACPNGVWIGSCPTTFNEGPGTERRKKIIQIAVAGPFGQLKCRAIQRWNRVRFCLEWHLEGFVKIIRCGAIPLDSRPWLGFVANENVKRELPVTDLNDIGDLEMLGVVSAELTDVAVAELIRETFLLLDAHWNKVEAIAHELVRRLEVSSKDFKNLVDSLA